MSAIVHEFGKIAGVVLIALVLWEVIGRLILRRKLKRPDDAGRSRWLTPITAFARLGAIEKFTALLFMVGLLQWMTLEKTDQTLRAAERAFVFLYGLDIQPVQAAGQKLEWTFLTNWMNNGGTQTKDLEIRLRCDKPPDFKTGPSVRTVIGPKQTRGVGYCMWEADHLEQLRQNNIHLYVISVATYKDIFDEAHVTQFCRDITVLSDPRVVGAPLSNVTSSCLDYPDCADGECDRK